MIIASVNNQTLSLRYDGVVSDSVRFLTVRFEFSDVWKDMTKVAVFRRGEEYKQIAFIEGNSMYLGDNTCYVPQEVLKSPAFWVSVYGINGMTTVTSDSAMVQVTETDVRENLPLDPTPPLLEQILLAQDSAAHCPTGGTAGQILRKKTDDDFDFEWSSSETEIPSKLSELQNDCGFGTYSKPAGGIPENDLSPSVKNSLNRADTALQEHQSLYGYAKKNDLSAVAVSGSYNDLLGKPQVDISYNPESGNAQSGKAVKQMAQSLVESCLSSDNVKSSHSAKSGDVYDVTYINTVVGDIEGLLSALR